MHINRWIKSQLDSMARTDRFSVEIFQPSISLRLRGLRCTAVNIPAKTMKVSRQSFGGGTPEAPYVTGVEYENDVTCSFMLDSTFEDKQKFELWQSYMYDEAYNLQYPEKYYGSVVISQLAVDNQPVYTVKLHDAFPSVVGGVSFTAETGVQSFDVTFSYRTWSSEFENSPSGLLGGLFNKYKRKLKSKVRTKTSDKLFG